MAAKQKLTQLNKASIYHFLQHNQLLERPLWVAVSGGLDSMVMLRLMLELRKSADIKFCVFHAHHGLSPNADHWQAVVERYCEINQVAIHSVKLNLKQSSQASLEQVARDARYQALSDLMPVNGVVLTGHHQTDQAETFLLRLLRSSGLRGLGAMKPLAPLPHADKFERQQSIARPLLQFDQNQLEEYAKSHHLEWVNDESNKDTVFDRNYVRHNVLPILSSRWPQSVKAISQTTKLLQQDQDLLEEYLQGDLRNYTESVDFGQIKNSYHEIKPLFELQGLNLTKLSQTTPLKQNALLKRFVEQYTAHTVGEKVLVEIVNSMLNTMADRQPVITLGDVELRTYKDWLFVINTAVFGPRDGEMTERFKVQNHNDDHNVEHNDGQIVITLDIEPHLNPYTDNEFLITPKSMAKEALAALNPDNMTLKLGELTARIRPNANSGRKKVSDLLKQKHCPAWLRHLVPVISVSGQQEVTEDGNKSSSNAIAVLGFAVAADLQK